MNISKLIWLTFSFLFSNEVFSSEIIVDKNKLSNKLEVYTDKGKIESTFNGYITSPGLLAWSNISEAHEARFVDDAYLDGDDWKFFYHGLKSYEKENSDIISDILLKNGVKTNDNEESYFSHRYQWDGSSGEYLSHNNLGLIIPKDGTVEFNLSFENPGNYDITLYSVNWLSSSDFEICINSICDSIKNDISFHMTSIVNKANLENIVPEDNVVIKIKGNPRQFDWNSELGYHSIEAINVKGVN